MSDYCHLIYKLNIYAISKFAREFYSPKKYHSRILLIHNLSSSAEMIATNWSKLCVINRHDYRNYLRLCGDSRGNAITVPNVCEGLHRTVTLFYFGDRIYAVVFIMNALCDSLNIRVVYFKIQVKTSIVLYMRHWLTHLPLVPHICESELDQHWFR